MKNYKDLKNKLNNERKYNPGGTLEGDIATNSNVGSIGTIDNSKKLVREGYWIPDPSRPGKLKRLGTDYNSDKAAYDALTDEEQKTVLKGYNEVLQDDMQVEGVSDDNLSKADRESFRRIDLANNKFGITKDRRGKYQLGTQGNRTLGEYTQSLTGKEKRKLGKDFKDIELEGKSTLGKLWGSVFTSKKKALERGTKKFNLDLQKLGRNVLFEESPVSTTVPQSKVDDKPVDTTSTTDTNTTIPINDFHSDSAVNSFDDVDKLTTSITSRNSSKDPYEYKVSYDESTNQNLSAADRGKESNKAVIYARLKKDGPNAAWVPVKDQKKTAGVLLGGAGSSSTGTKTDGSRGTGVDTRTDAQKAADAKRKAERDAKRKAEQVMNEDMRRSVGKLTEEDYRRKEEEAKIAQDAINKQFIGKPRNIIDIASQYANYKVPFTAGQVDWGNRKSATYIPLKKKGGVVKYQLGSALRWTPSNKITKQNVGVASTPKTESKIVSTPTDNKSKRIEELKNIIAGAKIARTVNDVAGFVPGANIVTAVTGALGSIGESNYQKELDELQGKKWGLREWAGAAGDLALEGVGIVPFANWFTKGKKVVEAGQTASKLVDTAKDASKLSDKAQKIKDLKDARNLAKETLNEANLARKEALQAKKIDSNVSIPEVPVELSMNVYNAGKNLDQVRSQYRRGLDIVGSGLGTIAKGAKDLGVGAGKGAFRYLGKAATHPVGMVGLGALSGINTYQTASNLYDKSQTPEGLDWRDVADASQGLTGLAGNIKDLHRIGRRNQISKAVDGVTHKEASSPEFQPNTPWKKDFEKYSKDWTNNLSMPSLPNMERVKKLRDAVADKFKSQPKYTYEPNDKPKANEPEVVKDDGAKNSVVEPEIVVPNTPKSTPKKTTLSERLGLIDLKVGDLPTRSGTDKKLFELSNIENDLLKPKLSKYEKDLLLLRKKKIEKSIPNFEKLYKFRKGGIIKYENPAGKLPSYLSNNQFMLDLQKRLLEEAKKKSNLATVETKKFTPLSLGNSEQTANKLGTTIGGMDAATQKRKLAYEKAYKNVDFEANNKAQEAYLKNLEAKPINTTSNKTSNKSVQLPISPNAYGVTIDGITPEQQQSAIKINQSVRGSNFVKTDAVTPQYSKNAFGVDIAGITPKQVKYASGTGASSTSTGTAVKRDGDGTTDASSNGTNTATTDANGQQSQQQSAIQGSEGSGNGTKVNSALHGGTDGFDTEGYDEDGNPIDANLKGKDKWFIGKDELKLASDLALSIWNKPVISHRQIIDKQLQGYTPEVGYQQMLQNKADAQSAMALSVRNNMSADPTVNLINASMAQTNLNKANQASNAQIAQKAEQKALSDYQINEQNKLTTTSNQQLNAENLSKEEFEKKTADRQYMLNHARILAGYRDNKFMKDTQAKQAIFKAGQTDQQNQKAQLVSQKIREANKADSAEQTARQNYRMHFEAAQKETDPTRKAQYEKDAKKYEADAELFKKNYEKLTEEANNIQNQNPDNAEQVYQANRQMGKLGGTRKMSSIATIKQQQEQQPISKYGGKVNNKYKWMRTVAK
jgi:hypothetical protein